MQSFIKTNERSMRYLKADEHTDEHTDNGQGRLLRTFSDILGVQNEGTVLYKD